MRLQQRLIDEHLPRAGIPVPWPWAGIGSSDKEGKVFFPLLALQEAAQRANYKGSSNPDTRACDSPTPPLITILRQTSSRRPDRRAHVPVPRVNLPRTCIVQPCPGASAADQGWSEWYPAHVAFMKPLTIPQACWPQPRALFEVSLWRPATQIKQIEPARRSLS